MTVESEEVLCRSLFSVEMFPFSINYLNLITSCAKTKWTKYKLTWTLNTNTGNTVRDGGMETLHQ